MTRESLSPTDYVLLDRFFAGETSAAESETARALLTRWPDVSERVQAIVSGVRALAPDAPDARRSWETLAAAIAAYRPDARTLRGDPALLPETIRPVGRNKVIFSGRAPRRGVWYTLAGVTVAVAATLILWTGMGVRNAWHAPASVATYVTGGAQRANITLNDGTTVALGVASRLDVPADFPAGNHTLRLTGEALFTVQHHAGRPFTVIAGGMATQVLGTDFVVRHYATDSATTIAVRDGKVSVGSTVVTAMQAAYVDQAGIVRVQPANPAQFSFATGVLTLTGLPFPAAIAELDRWYDADIRLGDSTLATRRVAGEYAAGSLADLTAYLEMTFNVRVVRDGRVLTLYQR